MLHVGLEIVRLHKTDGRAQDEGRVKDGGGGYLQTVRHLELPTVQLLLMFRELPPASEPPAVAVQPGEGG